jgi:biofilm protein TabA
MNTFIKSTLLLFLTANLSCCISRGQALQGETWTKEKATRWFKNNEWAGGLQLKPHESVNLVEFATQYHRNKILWDKAFNYLKTMDLPNIAPGKYPLMGDSMFVSVSEYTPKDLENAKWEAHKKYIDIQYVAKGKEKIGVAPLTGATVTEPFNETKDVGFFTSSDGQYYEAQPGTFYIFFPSDLHRPGIKTDGSDTVRKIVIKIRVD